MPHQKIGWVLTPNSHIVVAKWKRFYLAVIGSLENLLNGPCST